jgi:hypothetical protein
MTRAVAPTDPKAKPKRSNKPTRLRSAWKLVASEKIQILPDGTYRVPGNEEPWYTVDLRQDPPCHCKDMEFGGGDEHQCKHALACRLMQLGDQTLLNTLALMFAANEDGSTS